ncbi:MAG: hypothetical protein WCT50_03875 [Patescibacteria group bacterium]|jgi:hypothetical protein
MVSKKISKKARKAAKKIRKAAKAIDNLLVAIVDEPKVQRVLSGALITYMVLGFIGLAWAIISFVALVVSGFKSGGVADWLRDFIVWSPGLAVIWLSVVVTTIMLFLKHEKKPITA